MDDTLLGEVYGLLRDITISSDMKRLLDENLYISLNGILCRTSLEGRSQIVVPSVLIPEVLRLAHDEHLSGRQGSKKTLFRILCRFWWPTIQKDVVNYTQSCTICAQRMPVNKRARAPLLGRPKAAKPFEMIEMDIKGPLPRTDRGFQYILVVQDAFSRYAEMFGMPRQTAEEV